MQNHLLAAVGIPFIVICIASIALGRTHENILDRSHWWFENTGFIPREPFSTLTNLCLIFSAGWLTKQAPHDERAVSFGMVAYSIVIVGATSFLFHFDGARSKTAFHFGDLVSIITFGFMMSAIAFLNLLRVVVPPTLSRAHKGIELVETAMPLSAAFAGYVLYPGWDINKATLFSHGVFVILAVVTALVKRRVLVLVRRVRRRIQLDHRALLLVVLDYAAPLIAIGTAVQLNKKTVDLRRQAYKVDTPPGSCTPAGYEFYRPYMGGCCEGLEARRESTPEDHYGNCGGGNAIVYGCYSTILVCREADFVYSDDAVYEQDFFVRKYYETYDVAHGVWHLLCAIFLARISFLVLSDNEDDDVKEKLVFLSCVGLFCGAMYPVCLTYEIEYTEKLTILIFGAALSFLVLPSFFAIRKRLIAARSRWCRCCESCESCEKGEDDGISA